VLDIPRDKTSLVRGSLKQYKQTWPGGQTMATWSAGVGEDGRHLLDGKETWYYETGQKQWQANYEAGRKIGPETYWNRDGSTKWQRDHREDGTDAWTVWGPDGKIKARSHWRNKHLLRHTLAEH
jgi:hypothetical protein